MRRARCAKTTGTGSRGAAPPRHAISDVVRGPLPAIHVGFWPAITRRQSPPSPLARATSLAAVECGLWLGARDPEARALLAGALVADETSKQASPLPAG